MTRRLAFLAVAVSLAVAGCVSNAQILASTQGMAMQTAEARGKFELNCPTATAEVLSQELVQPRFQAPIMMMNAIQRAEYTIGVSGCGGRKTFIVICPKRATAASPQGPGGS